MQLRILFFSEESVTFSCRLLEHGMGGSELVMVYYKVTGTEMSLGPTVI